MLYRISIIRGPSVKCLEHSCFYYDFSSLFFFSRKKWSCRPNRRHYRPETWSVCGSPSHYSGKRDQPDQPNCGAIMKCLYVFGSYLSKRYSYSQNFHLFFGSSTHYVAPPTYFHNMQNLLFRNCPIFTKLDSANSGKCENYQKHF